MWADCLHSKKGRMMPLFVYEGLFQTVNKDIANILNGHAQGPFLAAAAAAAVCREKLWDSSYRGPERGLRVSDSLRRSGQRCFTWGWRSSAAAAGRGRCHTLWQVWARRAEGAHCQSSCYRRSPHSSCSGAGERERETDRFKTAITTYRVPTHLEHQSLCPSRSFQVQINTIQRHSRV